MAVAIFCVSVVDFRDPRRCADLGFSHALMSNERGQAAR
jgi:hypothetical protein